jgi:hypothetical protein
MNPNFFYRGFLIFNLLLSCSLFSWETTDEEARQIGHQIFLNECSGKTEKLVWWNERENFASLGIGHFLWYPKGIKGPFEETFPFLLTFFHVHGIKLPKWLKKSQSCPWNSHQEFMAAASETKKKELQNLLSNTVPLQVAFIVQRFEQALHKIFFDLSKPERQDLLSKIEAIGQTAQGKYALIDYLNFKGAGVEQSERYCGQGWGLKHVLQEMPGNAQDPLSTFAETAKMIIKRRVQNSPQERHEERWLPGWLKRIDSYQVEINHLKSKEESSSLSRVLSKFFSRSAISLIPLLLRIIFPFSSKTINVGTTCI